jgi:hypothetical protein
VDYFRKLSELIFQKEKCVGNNGLGKIVRVDSYREGEPVYKILKGLLENIQDAFQDANNEMRNDEPLHPLVVIM